MEQREKLIDIFSHFRECRYDETMDCNECDYKDVGECCDTRLADHLIANGVVVLPCRCCECEYAMTSKRFEKEKVACLYMMYPHDKNCFCYHAKRKGGDSDD